MWIDALRRSTPFDEPRMTKAIEELYAIKAITGTERRQIVQLHAEVITARIRALAETDRLQAARLTETLIVDATSAAETFELTYNAFASYERARDIKDMQRMLRAAIAADPTRPIVEAMRMRAAELEVDLDPKAAADDYLAASRQCRGCADYLEARILAAKLYLALGESRKAYAAATSYLADNGGRRADEVAWLATTAAARISADVAEKADRAYLRVPHPVHAAEIWLHLGWVARDRNERLRAIERAIKLTELDDKMIPIYGQALFARAELLAEDAAKISLAVASTKIAAALRERTQRLEAALAAYEEVAGSKDVSSTIAAIDRGAHAYEEFADAPRKGRAARDGERCRTHGPIAARSPRWSATIKPP